MTQDPSVTPGTPGERPSLEQDIAAGTSIGAGILLATVGLLQLLQGIAAVANDELFVGGVRYLYKFDVTGWGWIHILLGILLGLIGIALATGAFWARLAATFIASLSIIANFLWLPYYPWWSILILVLDVVVIWAVATWQPNTDY
jgi:hypothetical protein